MTVHAFSFEETLKNKTKKEILACKLLEMIFCGLLLDGDELPSERELGVLFGVSRETVRGAISVIAAYGLISVSHGSKSRICRNNELLTRCTEILPDLVSLEINKFDLSAVYKSRKIVEAAIVRRAAENLDETGIAEMKSLLANQHKLFDDPVHFQLSDKRFHKIIAEYSSNEILHNYSDELYAFGLNFRRQVMLQSGMIENSYHEHIAIYQALVQRDADAAEFAMLRHLDSVYSTTAKIMEG
jgi:DNA-binding FadR family transcriptional regulator